MTKLNLETPLINGCGTGSYLDIFERLELEKDDFGAYIIKSIGPKSSNPDIRKLYAWGKEKLGNPSPVVVNTGHVLLNSMALPTHPLESWIEELKNAKIKKPIIGSVWGDTPLDYYNIIDLVDRYVSAWEVNVSCPNKEKGEESLMESMTQKISQIFTPLREVTNKPLIAKLSPNEDYQTLAKVVMEHVDYICCGNTVGPGLVIDIYSKKPVLAGTYGGMSGPAMKPKIMKMVNDVYDVVKNSDVEIVASGGINTWQDVVEYAIAGASLFEIGTCAFIDLENNVGKSSKEVAQYSNEMWKDVQTYLRNEKTTLKNIIGSLEK